MTIPSQLKYFIYFLSDLYFFLPSADFKFCLFLFF